ncbi:MAG: hypothetical protein R3B06_24770 [Kofleriaceae bacterium]
MASPPAPAPAPAPSRARLSLTMVVLAIVGFAIPAVVLATLYKSCLGTTVRGSVAIRGAGLEWRQRLGGCAAEADGRAVRLTYGDEPRVRAMVDPVDGPRLELAPPDRPIIALTPATCPGLTVELRVAGHRDDGSAILDGNLGASCQLTSGPLAGAQIDVDGWWRGCKLPDAR